MSIIDQDPFLSTTGMASARFKTRLLGDGVTAGIRIFLIGALSLGLLLSVAFFNGYPTVFSDTGSYLWTGAFFVAFSPYRAPGYSLFTRFTSFRTTAWFTIVAQGLIVIFILRETCDTLIGGEREFRDRCLLASVCGLTLLTSLPWLVSLLMPDVFAGVLFLSAFLLTFADGLRSIQKAAVAVTMVISVISHTSLFPISILLVASLIVLRLLLRRPSTKPDEVAVTPRHWQTITLALWLLVPIVTAALGTAALNRKTGLGFRLAPSQDMFLLARLFGDGIAGDFLRDNCSTRPFISCRYLSNLPVDGEDFLFRHPLLHDLVGHDDEIREIARGALLAHPLKFAISGGKETLHQLVRLGTGEEFRSGGSIYWTAGAVRLLLPRDADAFTESRQSRGLMLPHAVTASRVDTTAFWLSLTGCLWFAFTGRFPRVNEYLYAAIVFLVINALICASLAGVFDRYQSRVAWIIPYCLMLYLGCAVREWMRTKAQRSFTESSACVSAEPSA